MMRIGVIADTHGLFDRAILRHFSGMDHILHAGDIGDPAVIEQLRALAPVTTVSGNVDGYEASGFEKETLVELGGKRIALRHILYERGKLTTEGRAFLDRERPDVCVFGHTHQPRVEWYGATLLFNPGSAGPKRFSLPRQLGVLTISRGIVTPMHVVLEDHPD
jgi:putative phosphoesterase